MSTSHVVVPLALSCLLCVLIMMALPGRVSRRRPWIRAGRGSRRLRHDPSHVRPGVESSDRVEGGAYPRLHRDVVDARGGAGRQIRGAWMRANRANRPALRRLDRRINQPPYRDRPVAERRLPPVEQIAAELRRLHRQRRHGLSNESEKWSAAVTTAYDAWLVAACRRLDIAEDLTTLAGIDLEIERIRVEGQLETAGLILR